MMTVLKTMEIHVEPHADFERAATDAHAQRLFLLSEASTLLLANANPADALVDLFALVAKSIGLDFAFHYRCGNGALHLVAAWGLTPEQEIAASQIEFGQTVCGVVAATRKEAYFTAIQCSDSELVAIAKILGMESYFSQPLLSGADLQGTVSFGRIGRPFSSSECETLRAIAAHLSTALERYQSEANLKAREAELQFALKAGRFGAWTLDLSTSELTTSETCRANFGRDPAKPFTYVDLRDAVHPGDQNRMRQAVEQSIATGADYDIEYRILTPLGEVRWVSIRAAPSFGADGAPLTLAGVSMDVTNSVRARQYQLGLVRLSDLFRDAQTVAQLSLCAGSVLGETLGISRAAYGTIEGVTDSLHVEMDWTAQGVDTLRGVIALRDYGSFIDSLKAGELIVINDVRLDERTSSPAASTGPKGRHARSFVNVPVLEAGALVAVMFVDCAEVRGWTSDELAFIQEVANRTRTAIERARSELALRATADRLQALNADLERQVVERSSERGTTWQLSPFLLSVLDLTTGQFVRVNPAWEHTLGWSEEEMTGASFLEFLPVDDVEASLAAWGQVSGGSAVLDFENRYRAKDGSYRTLSWVAVPEGGRLYSTTRDITDETERARLLTERTAERDALWESSEDLLVVADYDGKLLRLSPSWTRLLGYSEEVLLAGKYQEIIHPDDYPLVAQALITMRDTGKPARFEDRVRTIDGSWKTIAWVLSPQPGGRRLSGVGHNISEQREIEDRLRQSQKMEAMGSLTGGVAHDFNNLLTPIVGALDMLQSKGLGGDREKRLIAGAMQSADRAKTLVQRLLAFARRQPLQARGIDLAPLVGGMADLVSSTAGPQIRVVVDTAEGLPPAKADPNQLEMAILNLAVNARDAMPEGGVLRITVDAETVGRQHRTNLVPGRYLLLSVADTGSGMDDATLKRAVEPFFSTKGVGKGTGLGLSMVHGLASQLGGALTIRSAPGVGTNVELWLPQSAEVTATSEAAAELAPVARGSGTILLVDDEDVVRLSTADMLIDLGYRVVEAASAEEALKLIYRGLKPDLLVTDHLMPGMSGTELARTVQNDRPKTKVLIVSGYAEAEGIAPDLPRLMKPFRNAELAASIAGLAFSRTSPLRG